VKKRLRKYQRKQDLAHIKAWWALFQQISADTKDLDERMLTASPLRATEARRATGGSPEDRRDGRCQWSGKRTFAAVLRLLRGEDLETLSRKLGVTAVTLCGGRSALAGDRSPGRRDVVPGNPGTHPFGQRA
jgi:hypothetical protein